MIDKFVDQARALGAVKVYREMYPVRVYEAEVFAVRFFDNQERELAYYLPEVSDCLMVFAQPRIWSAEFMAGLLAGESLI